MNWIVVSTRSGCEHMANHEVKRLGYDAYLPLVAQPPKFEPRPFFPGYLFVDLEPAMGLWRPLNTAKGVTAVLRTGDHPSRMPANLIELLRRREEGGVITIKAKKAPPPFKKGEAVRVLEGSFGGFEGVFEQARPQDRVLILLTMFGREVHAEIDRRDVAPVAKTPRVA